MRMDIRGRGVGKTYDLIKWMVESDPEPPASKKGIVVAYNQHRNRVLEQIEQMYPGDGKNWIHRVFTVAEVKGLSRDFWELGVDNVDIVLEQMFDNRVTVATLEDRDA